MGNNLDRFNETVDSFFNRINSKAANSYSILRLGAENEPEKLIKSSQMLAQALRADAESAHLNCFFVDHKEHFERHFHESVFIAGESNVHFSVQKHTLLQKVFVFNDSKVVIDYNTRTDTPKILQVHLYDSAEVYIDAGNNVDIFVRFLSGKAKANVKTDISCTLVKSNYNSSGLIKSVKVEPGQIIYYDSTGIIKSVKVEPDK